jgi:hypothetical protein
MIALIQYHLLTLIVALLIGIITAWWVFSHREARTGNRPHEESTD